MSAVTGTSTECRAFGVVSGSNTTPLANTLRGLCSKYSKMNVYEVSLSIPGKNNIKMTRRSKSGSQRASPFVEKQPERWCVVWESDANRGPAFRELPAAVREVCESYVSCNNAPAYWQALGAKFEYDMVKDGNEYICYHNNYEMRVQLMRILSLKQPGNPDSGTKSASDKYVLDVWTRVPESGHAEGAKAVGSFGQSLQPLVVLQRADKIVG